jgi:hypothetical protein
MKAISLWQPWASLWVSPRKVHDTRNWSTTHRGWLAVHAAKRWEDEIGEALRDLLEDEFGKGWRDALPLGAIVGAVNLVGVFPADRVHGEMLDAAACDDLMCGDFSTGRYAWRKSEFRRLREPIPFVGKQGFFEVPDDILTREMVSESG